MTEERYVIEKVVESCNSMTELNNKLDELESKALQFMMTTNADDSINIAAVHYKAQLSTIVDNDGRVKPVVVYADDPWQWYNIKVPEGFIFD
nr:MAG TPA: hypothetical protein [Caudoviricetes sp.]